MRILGYSERGLINSLFFEMKYSEKSATLLGHFLNLAHFKSEKNHFRFSIKEGFNIANRTIIFRFWRRRCRSSLQ